MYENGSSYYIFNLINGYRILRNVLFFPLIFGYFEDVLKKCPDGLEGNVHKNLWIEVKV